MNLIELVEKVNRCKDITKYLEVTDNDGKVIGKKKMCISIWNRKGGTAKTANSLSLCYTYASLGFKVLLIDLDPQASATQLLGVNKNVSPNPGLTKKNMSSQSKLARKKLNSVWEIDDLFGNKTKIETKESEYEGISSLLIQEYDVRKEPVTKEDIEEKIVKPTYIETVTKIDRSVFGHPKTESHDEVREYGFWLIPASEELADFEMFYSNLSKDRFPRSEWKKKSQVSAGYIVRNIVEKIKETMDFDIIICDCPPSLGILSSNGLSGCDGVAISCFNDQQSINSLAKAKGSSRDFNHLTDYGGRVLGVIMSAIENRSILKPLIEIQIAEQLGFYVFNNDIPRITDATKVNSMDRILAQINEKAYEAYKKLGEELIIRFLDNEQKELEKRKIVESKKVETPVKWPDDDKKMREDAVKWTDEYFENNHIYPDEASRQGLISAKYNSLVIDFLRKKYDEGEWKKPTTEVMYNINKYLDKIRRKEEEYE